MRHGIDIDATGYICVDLGGNNDKVRLQSDMESIAVDVSFDFVSVCIVGCPHKIKIVKIFRLNGYSVQDVANLLEELILTGKQKSFILSITE